jgi:hypothetical protein
VTNQAVGPGNTGDIFYFMRVLLFIALLSMGYALSRPTPVARKEQDLLLSASLDPSLPEQQWPRLLPWQRQASEKAIERYAGSQEKKWRRWNEAMFERST